MVMNVESRQQIMESVEHFRLPRYRQIPNVGLYLEQAAKYISEYLAPLGECALTSSMISNYVKKGLIDSPVKKQYGRDQIAYLFFIAVGKSVLSLDALAAFIQLQKQSYDIEPAYDYFCQELENVLQFTFEVKELLENNGEDASLEKRLLYTCIVAAVQKVYLEKHLELLCREQPQST